MGAVVSMMLGWWFGNKDYKVVMVRPPKLVCIPNARVLVFKHVIASRAGAC